MEEAKGTFQESMEICISSRIRYFGIRIIVWSFFAAAGIFSFLLAEGWIIGLVALLGAIKAFFVLSFICICISSIIVYFYNQTEARRGPLAISQRIQAWITEKEQSLNPVTIQLARTSKLLALFFSTITVGPFLTTIVVKVLGYEKWVDYGLSFLSSLIFSIVWVSIYSGAITILKGIFA